MTLHPTFSVRFQELKIATAAIVAALLYQSVQGPGAVTGCTLSEYAKATYITGLVKSHKTSSYVSTRRSLQRQAGHLRESCGSCLTTTRSYCHCQMADQLKTWAGNWRLDTMSKRQPQQHCKKRWQQRLQ